MHWFLCIGGWCRSSKSKSTCRWNRRAPSLPAGLARGCLVASPTKRCDRVVGCDGMARAPFGSRIFVVRRVTDWLWYLVFASGGNMKLKSPVASVRPWQTDDCGVPSWYEMVECRTGAAHRRRSHQNPLMRRRFDLNFWRMSHYTGIHGVRSGIPLIRFAGAATTRFAAMNGVWTPECLKRKSDIAGGFSHG